jgi:nitrous oxidase accessory protein
VRSLTLILVAAAALTAPAPASAGPPLGEIGRRIAAARDGDTIRVGPGVYHERIRIDKPVHLIGEPGAVIDGGGSGDVVEITAPGVEFRGFVVRDTGIDLDKENCAIRVLAGRAVIAGNTLDDVLFGIDLREAPDSIVRGNRIGGKRLDIARRGDGLRLWRSDRSLVEGNAVHDGRDAILWYSQGVTVRGNTSRRCRYGLHLMFSDQVTIEGNELTENSVGVYLMYSKGITLSRNRLIRNRGPSGYGIGLKEADQYTIADNLIAGNRVGAYLDGSPFTTARPGLFTRNTFAGNDTGLTFLPSVRGNELSENNFVDNTEQVCVLGRGELKGNSFSKDGRGNFWTDYVGYDQDGDGVGDFVHESQTLFERMLDKEPKLRLFLFSPAQQAVEFVGRALPAVRPEPKFTDEYPLMAPAATGTPAPLGGTAPSSLVPGRARRGPDRRGRRRDRRGPPGPLAPGPPHRRDHMIQVENLTMRFGRTAAVDGVSLSVPAGGSVALWGTNGAGKTTILRCVLGLLRYQGMVRVGTIDVRRQGKRARRLVGYVPQELGFNDDLRVGEAVAFFARLKGVAVDSVDAVLGRVGLRGQDGKRMRELSGGMKQRWPSPSWATPRSLCSTK